jgi:transposase
MPTAYSDDLRRKLLEAHQRKEGSLSQLAQRFSVSQGWALKISSQLHRTGKMERAAGRRRGPASKITAEIQKELKDWIGKQADLTLAELQLRLYEQRQLEISLSRLWAVLKGLGLRLKKVAPRLRARYRSGASSTLGLAPGLPRDRSGEPDFPG